MDHIKTRTAAYTGVIPIMLNKIDTNEQPVINGDGSQAYDFIDAEDAGRCNVLALESNISDEFIMLVQEFKLASKELCDTILEIKNSDLVVKYNPYNEDDARQMVQNRIGDPKKAEKDLGFKYRYDLKSGLRRLVDWRRKNY